MPKTTKTRIDARLSDESIELIEGLKAKWNTDRTGVIEKAISRAAEQEGVRLKNMTVFYTCDKCGASEAESTVAGRLGLGNTCPDIETLPHPFRYDRDQDGQVIAIPCGGTFHREERATTVSMSTYTQGGFGIKGWGTFLIDWIKEHPEMMPSDYYRQNPVYDRSVLELLELTHNEHTGYDLYGVWGAMKVEDNEEIGYQFLEKITREHEEKTGKPVDRSNLKNLFPQRYI